ncbi:RNA methyltransferase [Salinarchaeum sp. IM2453]|uniref:RNA methyltransferase n=1 Tax=Salinarchaeum sp. IM2453 TaxID=2862870 RepID=UPI002104750F|nr:RNA methyltransferase [Salinarchaeum sp. IM2453]
MTDTHSPAVAVVGPQTPGNIGTIARAMKNFGLEELLLIDAPELDPDGEAYGFAGQARDDILPNHRRPSFDELVSSYYTVGFTATTGKNSEQHVRFPYTTPAELHSELQSVKAPTALVFGREDKGLSNQELSRLDRVCSIPASGEYPSLNLGQAVTVTLYELRSLTGQQSQLSDIDHERADEVQIERLYEIIDQYLEAINYTDEKHDKTMRLVRRLFGRSHPTEREVITLMGVFRRGAQFADPPENSDQE